MAFKNVIYCRTSVSHNDGKHRFSLNEGAHTEDLLAESRERTFVFTSVSMHWNSATCASLSVTFGIMI
jgi:hypothetical protein